MTRGPGFGALVRVFFARLFEHEGASGDLRGLAAWLVAFLAAPGVVVPFFAAFAWSRHDPGNVASWGWTRIAARLGVDALRTASLGEKSLYLTFACASAALVAALVWNSLLPDRRDALVLGALPVTPSTIVRARLAALGGFVLLLAAGTHTLAALTFGMLLAAGGTFTFALRGIAAHFGASVLATLFVLSAIVAAQGLAVVLAGPRWYARVSSLLQVAIVATALAAFFVLMDVSVVTRAWFQSGTPARPWWVDTPPLWFLGLYEWMLGTSSPLMAALARTAAVATTAAVVCAVVVYPFAYRRVAAGALSQMSSRRMDARDAVLRFARERLSRPSAAGGVTQLFLSTITRVENHRLVMAAAVGAAFTWAIASGLAIPPMATWRHPPMRVLAIPLAVQFFLIAGLRIAASLPSDLRPAWMFDVASPTRRQIRAAMERVMAALVIVPVAAVSSVVAWWWWGAHAALFHAAMNVAAGAALAEVFLRRVNDVPCAHVVAPDADAARMRWPLYVAGFVLFTTGFAGVESLFLTSIVDPRQLGPAAPDFTIWRVGFVAVLGGFAILVRRSSLSASAMRDGEDFDTLRRAIQEGRENRSPATPVAADRDDAGVRAPALTTFRAPTTERDRWFEGFSARPADVARDLRLAVRRVRRAPGFALFAIATLAVGTGATITAYSMVAVVLSQPAGFDDVDRIVVVGTPTSGEMRASLSWPDFQDLRSAGTTLTALEAESEFPASISANTGATFVSGALVTGGYFQALGVRPVVGRLLIAHDSEPDAPAVIVLAESAWRLHFASDPAIVGRVVSIGGAPYEVVGIAPRAFRGTNRRPVRVAFWTPLSHAPLTDPALTAFRDPSRRDRAYLRVLGRMKPDVDRARVDLELREISRRLDAGAPIVDRAGRPAARRWTTGQVNGLDWSMASMGIGTLIMIMPVLVLLVACTNLANLVASSGMARRNELVVRRALGASRWSLIRAGLVEHGLLCLAGGLGGVVVAEVLITRGMAIIIGAFGSTPQTQFDVRIDLAALAVAFAATVLSVMVAAFLPAIRLTRRSEDARPLGELSSWPSARWRGRRHLIAFQVAASLALLLMTALCVRQVIAARASRDIDVDLVRVGVLTVDFGLRTHDAGRVMDTAERILAAVSRAPDVDSSAVATSLPALEHNPDTGPAVVRATPNLFRVLGLKLHAGRAFAPGESGVAVISESEARAEFGSSDVVGRDLVLSSASGPDGARRFVVVGVVADAGRDYLTRQGLRQVYVPYAFVQDTRTVAPPVWVLARSARRDARALSVPLANAARGVDADLPIRFAGRADVFVNGPVEVLGFVTMILGGLAGVALLLSATGLYAVTSQLVAHRTREMGIRLALGADRVSIVRLVMRDAIRPLVTGLGAGLVVATIARLAMRPVFRSGVTAFDVVAFVIAAVPLVAAALIACYVPARRAARVDPNEALRHL